MDRILANAKINSATELLASQKRGLIPKEGANKRIKEIVKNISDNTGMTPQEIALEIKEQEKVYDETLPLENYKK